jgi:hypothetical protein
MRNTEGIDCHAGRSKRPGFESTEIPSARCRILSPQNTSGTISQGPAKERIFQKMTMIGPLYRSHQWVGVNRDERFGFESVGNFNTFPRALFGRDIPGRCPEALTEELTLHVQ